MKWLPVILILPYLYLLLKIYRNLLKIKTFTVSTKSSAFVSVVVACRNGEKKLPSLLKYIADQDYPQNQFEVIIVNDNSTDNTYEVVSGFTGISNKTVLNNNGKGKKHAIRTGIDAAFGTLIITTDDDCRMGQSWISTIAAFYEVHKPAMIICPVRIESGNGFFRKFQELEFLSLQGITAGCAVSDDATMCNGANLAFTRKDYLDHTDNLQDEIGSGDDIFLLHSLKQDDKSEICWLESDKVMVTTASSPSVTSFFKQRRRWISKSKVYKDCYTILLGIVTFVTILLQISLLVASFFNPVFLWVLLVVFSLKSIPDFLILINTTVRYWKRSLIYWFLPVQVIYPFYVFGVFLYSVIWPEKQDY